jgi:hypothetical protein
MVDECGDCGSRGFGVGDTGTGTGASTRTGSGAIRPGTDGA